MSKRLESYSSPDLEPYLKELGEPTRFGEALSIVGHPFAPPLNNEALVRQALDFGLPISQVDALRKAINATGFTTRYFSNMPDRETDIEKNLDRVVDIGAILLKESMAAQGWDGVDVFIDTSAFLPTSINRRILDRLGMDKSHVISRSYRYACAGAVGAFIDSLSDPSLRDARIIIGALEPLSLLVDRDQFLSPEKVAFPAIFGDANTFLAFDPARFNLENKRIVVQPDGGVIKLHTLYDFDKTISSPGSIPGHYRFEGGGEKIFRYSDQGAFLDIPVPDHGAVYMNGIETGLFFGNETSRVIRELLHDFGNPGLLKELNGKNLILHPASKPVVDRIGKLLFRGEYKYLSDPSIPFLMDKAQQSNGSSATTLNRWRYMIDNDLLDPSKPMFWIAPGIGSAIAGGIGWINP